jgi:septal ring factor EnvC (AmiA/AmiB activator)
MGAKLAIVMFMLLLGAGGIGYWYYNDTQERLAILTSNNAKLNTAVELNEQTISSLEQDYAKASSELATLNEQYISIRRQNQELADKLQNIDLTAAAIANAEGIERAVNRGTLNAGRCFELLSGADLTDKERNAQNGIAFNKECPWFYDTYKSRGLLNETTSN